MLSKPHSLDGVACGYRKAKAKSASDNGLPYQRRPTMTVIVRPPDDVKDLVEQAMQCPPESLTHKEWFEMGEMVDPGDGKLSWKHRVWRDVTWEDMKHIRAAARHYYGCSEDQQRVIPTANGTYDYEAVYGCSGNGRYRLEDWDGSCAIGDNRRKLGERWPVGMFVLYEIRGRELVGTIKRHSRKTMTVLAEGIVTKNDEESLEWDIPGGRQGWWRVPWHLVNTTFIDEVAQT